MNRRQFLHKGASCIALSLPTSALAIGVPHRVMTHIERVDAALQGRPVDRPPYTIYGAVEQSTPERDAHEYIRFHESFNTDIVKIMGSQSYLASGAKGWFDVKAVDSQFADHLKMVQMVGRGLKNRAYFVDTICSPFSNAWQLFKAQRQRETGQVSKHSEPDLLQEFREFQISNADEWASALDVITRSTIDHICRLMDVGASGAFVKLVNMSSRFGTPQEYRQLAGPYDERIARELSGTKITILHLEELDTAFLNLIPNFNVPVVHYSTVRTGIPISAVRKYYAGTIMGGVDEASYDRSSVRMIRKEWTAARTEAGPRFIAALGGPFPVESSGRQIGHLQDSLGAWQQSQALFGR